MSTDYIIGPDEQLHYTTDGTGAGSWVRLGLTQDGAMTEDSEVREQRAVGDHRPIALRPGLFRAFGNARFTIQNGAFLEQCLRTSGRLPALAFRAGQPDNTQEYATHTQAKIDSLSLECAAGGEVVAGIDWKAENAAFNSSGIPDLSPSANAAFMWYNTTITGLANIGNERVDGGGLEVVSFASRIENNIDWLPVIGTSEGRRAKYIREGTQRVTLSLRVLIPEDTNIAANELSYIESVVLNLSNGTQDVTITLTDLLEGTFERPLRPEDLNTHGINLIAKAVSIAA